MKNTHLVKGLIFLVMSAVTSGACAMQPYTDFHRAAVENDVADLTQYVEQEQIDINTYAGDENETPLLCAAKKGSFAAVVYLVEHGADIEA